MARQKRVVIEVSRRGRDGASGRSTALVSLEPPVENVGLGDIWYDPDGSPGEGGGTVPGGSAAVISETAPENPGTGTIWIDPTT